MGDEIARLKTCCFGELLNSTERYLAGLRKNRDEIISLLRHLEKLEVTEVVHPCLYKTCLEARRLLVEKMTRVMTEFDNAKLRSPSDIAEVKEKITQTLARVGHIMKAHGEKPSMLFEREMKTLKRLLAELCRTANAFIKTIQKFEPRIEKLNRLQIGLEEYTKMCAELKQCKKRLEEMYEKVQEARADLEEKRLETKELVESGPYSKAVELSEAIRKIDAQKAYEKHAFEKRLHAVSKVLRKVGKIKESELSKDERNMLAVIVHDPVAVLETKQKALAAQRLLEFVLKILEVSELVEGKKKQKLVRELRSIVSDGFVVKTFEKIADLEMKRKQLLDEFEEKPQIRHAKLEATRMEIEERIKNIETQIHQEKRRIAVLTERVQRLESEIAGMSREIGLTVTFS